MIGLGYFKNTYNEGVERIIASHAITIWEIELKSILGLK